MHQDIKKKFYRKLDCKLYNQRYYDFSLYKGETSSLSPFELESMAIADFSDLYFENGKLYSTIYWTGSTNNGVEMHDIGMTGVDNGFIWFDKTRTTNKDFLKLYFNSTYSIPSGDTRLFLSPVSGCTQYYSYPYEIVTNDDDKVEFLKLFGGFFQGFFKLDGFDYQVLPHMLNCDMVLHFEIRPKDYEIPDNSINNLHPENSGIFFFMGTRAENKFWKIYNNVNEDEPSKDDDLPISEEYFNEDGYVTDGCDVTDICENFYDDYFDDPYFGDNSYQSHDAVIDYDSYIDSVGHEFTKHGYYDIETDNKFILFNHTKTGYTVDTWIDGTSVVFTGRKDWKDVNYFTLFDRTPSGMTVDKIDEYQETVLKEDYNIYKDIRDNVFALRIREDGAIGYRYGILNCDSENKYELIEEYSKSGMVKKDQWNSINVRFAILNPTCDKCDTRKKKMRIMIYVNGFLKFISKQLDAFSFRALDDVYQKQEGVPYNISLGGGTIGLLETIMPYYYELSNYILPIEKDFCGSFIGDIKSFKIYQGFIDYYSIKNYL